MIFFSISKKKGLRKIRFFEQFRVKKVISKFRFFLIEFFEELLFWILKKN